jgi:hypothetical protein
MNLPNYDTRLAAAYLDRDDAQGLWEARSDLLRTVRPQLVQHLADMLDCEISAKIQWADIVGLRRALGAWLDGLEDGELEDRLAVELGLVEEWDRP